MRNLALILRAFGGRLFAVLLARFRTFPNRGNASCSGVPAAPRLRGVDDDPIPTDPRPVTFTLSRGAREIVDELSRLRGLTPAGLLETILRDAWDGDVLRKRKAN